MENILLRWRISQWLSTHPSVVQFRVTYDLIEGWHHSIGTTPSAPHCDTTFEFKNQLIYKDQTRDIQFESYIVI